MAQVRGMNMKCRYCDFEKLDDGEGKFLIQRKFKSKTGYNVGKNVNGDYVESKIRVFKNYEVWIDVHHKEKKPTLSVGINHDDVWEDWEIPINFCPICGRDLRNDEYLLMTY